MTYNIRHGGVDDDLTQRLPSIHEVVAAARPDVLAIQEANEFELRDHRRLYEFERAVGMRGFLGLSPSGYHGALFLRAPLQPRLLRLPTLTTRPIIELSFHADRIGPIAVAACHFDPADPTLRLSSALWVVSPPPAILLGDLNNCRGDDPGAADAFERFSPLHRARQARGAIDDRLFDVLEKAGYVDLYRRFHPSELGTTMTAAGGVRLDYIFATGDLADLAVSCDVVRTPEVEGISDHYPVVADFDFDVSGPASGSAQ